MRHLYSSQGISSYILQKEDGQSLQDSPRAYRYLSNVNPLNMVSSILILIGIESVLIIYLKDLGQFFSHITIQLAYYVGLTAHLGQDSFYGIPLFPLEFLVPSLDSYALLLWIAGGTVGILVLFRYRLFEMPLRIILICNLAIMVISASSVLVIGHAGYSATDFSQLYLRTVVTLWLMIPCVAGGLSLMFPFSLSERIGMVVLSLFYSFALAVVRYVVFMGILAHSGVVLIPSLYFFLGLPLDYTCLTGFFSSFLLRRVRKLYHGKERAWS